MGQPKTVTEVDCGVDYLTCTFKPSCMFTRLRIRIEKIAQSEIRLGNFKREWSMCGYDGFKVGGLECGTRDDGMIVRLSGPTAQDHWRKIGSLADNCSRIDLQVTVLTEEPCSQTISRHWKEMKRWTKQKQRRPEVTLIANQEGAGTIYSGKRQSLSFLRCYSRYSKTKNPQMKNHLRYEVEYKSELAKEVLRTLLTTRSCLHICREQCQAMFSVRGCRLQLTQTAVARIRVPRTTTDVIGRLQWLNEAVRGTIEQLCESGHESEVIDALNLTSYFDVRPSRSVTRERTRNAA